MYDLAIHDIGKCIHSLLEVKSLLGDRKSSEKYPSLEEISQTFMPDRSTYGSTLNHHPSGPATIPYAMPKGIMEVIPLWD